MVTESPRLDFRTPMVVGYIALFTLVFGVGAWAAVTNIAGAVVGVGLLEVQGNRQVIQHPIGGVIKAIYARDGVEVTAGDVLVIMDGNNLYPELDTVEGQWFEIIARKSRLQAERDGNDTITFNDELVKQATTEPALVALMTAQRQQFEARRTLQSEESAQLDEQQVQIAKQNEGLVALAAATDRQSELVQREVDAQQTLHGKGLTEMTRLLTPQRELARLQGTAGQIESSIAENRGKIAELEIEKVRLTSKVREEAITELRELEFREIELRERRRLLSDQIAKLNLRAPVSGIIYGSTVDTLNGVIRAAEPVMYVVPKDAELIVRSRIDPIHIDQVTVGQSATLRFSAFNQRTTPEVIGRVAAVSADAYQDERTGLSYYEVEISIGQAARTKLKQKLIPGMPVEAFVSTNDRTALSFIVKPMSDYFNRAFREG